MDDPAVEEKEYLWSHFELNADQRLKAFNFVVVFSVFANGGVFTALDKGAHTAILILLGGFMCVLSFVFGLIDARSQTLLRLAVPGLKEYEKRFPEHSRLFALYAASRSPVIRYTTALRLLFVLQLLFGLGLAVDGVVALIHLPHVLAFG